MAYQPLHDNVLIQKTEADSEMKKQGSIFLPGTSSDGAFIEGRVIARGSGMLLQDGRHVPMEFRDGDKVYFHESQAFETRVDGVKCLIVKYQNIVAYESM